MMEMWHTEVLNDDFRCGCSDMMPDDVAMIREESDGDC